MTDQVGDDFDELLGCGPDEAPAKRTRERSTIEFPYSDLESTVEMVRTLHAKAGTQCEDVQLAAWMNQTASGGGFRSRLSAGRMYGLIETNGPHVTVTSMGLDAIDGDRAAPALAEAFLRVPLFRQMYEKYKGYALPPPQAIESQMEGMGVAPKQKDRARQTFTKSAQYSGYIDAQTGRLTKPAFAAPSPPPERIEDRQSEGNGNGNNGNGNNGSGPSQGGGIGSELPPGLHPFIVGLLHELPPAKTAWSVDKRVDWLTAAATMFKLIYSGEGTIKVSGGDAAPAAPLPPAQDNGG
ncbi:hypothetical protein [Sphingomonas sp. M1A8_2b]